VDAAPVMSLLVVDIQRGLTALSQSAGKLPSKTGACGLHGDDFLGDTDHVACQLPVLGHINSAGLGGGQIVVCKEGGCGGSPPSVATPKRSDNWKTILAVSYHKRRLHRHGDAGIVTGVDSDKHVVPSRLLERTTFFGQRGCVCQKCRRTVRLTESVVHVFSTGTNESYVFFTVGDDFFVGSRWVWFDQKSREIPELFIINVWDSVGWWVRSGVGTLQV
jgi:hypothetical protein